LTPLPPLIGQFEVASRGIDDCLRVLLKDVGRARSIEVAVAVE